MKQASGSELLSNPPKKLLYLFGCLGDRKSAGGVSSDSEGAKEVSSASSVGLVIRSDMVEGVG